MKIYLAGTAPGNETCRERDVGYFDQTAFLLLDNEPDNDK